MSGRVLHTRLGVLRTVITRRAPCTPLALKRVRAGMSEVLVIKALEEAFPRMARVRCVMSEREDRSAAHNFSFSEPGPVTHDVGPAQWLGEGRALVSRP
jgi:hypothetical protein